MPPIFVGSTELTTVGDIKIGGTDVQEVYVGATKVFPSGAPPFTPSDIAGLQLWFDASDASTFTLEVGNKVSEWRDKSGNDFHVTQATDAARPERTTDDGLDAVQCFRDSQLENSSVSVPMSEITCYMVYKTTLGDSNKGYLSLGGNTWYIGALSEDTVRWQSGTDLMSFSINRNERFWVKVFADTASATEGVMTDSNGNSDPDAFMTAPATQTLLRVCNKELPLVTGGLTGFIHEIVFYEATLTAQETSDLEAYLEAKWGFL